MWGRSAWRVNYKLPDHAPLWLVIRSLWSQAWCCPSIFASVLLSFSSPAHPSPSFFLVLPTLFWTKMERSMLNITYKDRRTNIWVRERTTLIDMIYTVRKMKWSWAGHVNRLNDNRWTSRVATWRPYDKKRRQGRPAKRWRDDLDKYWSDTIGQRTAQDRVIWRRHAEAFAQPRDTMAALWWWWMMILNFFSIHVRTILTTFLALCLHFYGTQSQHNFCHIQLLTLCFLHYPCLTHTPLLVLLLSCIHNPSSWLFGQTQSSIPLSNCSNVLSVLDR